MIEKQLHIMNKVGLHARPASQFVQTAKKFKCSVRLAYGGREVDAKSILSVLTLGVNAGALVTLRADGEGESEAVDALAALVESDFGEAA
jgi:phosphocarrier protein HPr